MCQILALMVAHAMKFHQDSSASARQDGLDQHVLLVGTAWFVNSVIFLKKILSISSFCFVLHYTLIILSQLLVSISHIAFTKLINNNRS